MLRILLLLSLLLFASCKRLENIGKTPDLSSTTGSNEQYAMMATPIPETTRTSMPSDHASLWSKNRHSLLGDRRAAGRGDIVTVSIEINDKAEISNTSSRGRDGSESMQIPNLLGIPQRIRENTGSRVDLANALQTKSKSSSSGTGSIKRNEKLTLKVAATVIDVLQNGILRIQGSQEIRVNFELRELLISGYVRPEDISRKNEITYDKIASARVSYGGRGQISDMQQPRYGQQISDVLLPF
ncbi:MAG: flagellar basal body L-ring protein FlgH [Halocynthiibacter sp.]